MLKCLNMKLSPIQLLIRKRRPQPRTNIFIQPQHPHQPTFKKPQNHPRRNIQNMMPTNQSPTQRNCHTPNQKHQTKNYINRIETNEKVSDKHGSSGVAGWEAEFVRTHLSEHVITVGLGTASARIGFYHGDEEYVDDKA